MGAETADGNEVSLSIPEAGLNEVLRAWSGQGQLWEALGGVVDDDLAEISWSTRDIRRRAHRVLFAELTDGLSRWPRSSRAWLEALPAESTRERVLTPMPTSGTSWRETRRLGWPPRSFVGHARSRVADTLLVTTLRWTLEQLMSVRKDAVAVEPTVDEAVHTNIKAAEGVLGIEPVVSAEAIAPSRADIHALRREGWPWNAVAPVSEVLRSLHAGSLLDLARRLVMPSPELRWRLFHLGVLGQVLLALRQQGCRVESIRPLSGTTIGPAYRVCDGRGRDWDLWFEASGAWSYYGFEAPYKSATAGVAGQKGTLGADLLLIRRGERALAIECKYYQEVGGVAKRGYQQAVTYAAELRTKLVDEVFAIVVGPQEIVLDTSSADTIAGRIGVSPPQMLEDLIIEFLEEG